MTTLILNKLTVSFPLPLLASITVIGGAKTILIKFYLNVLHMYHKHKGRGNEY